MSQPQPSQHPDQVPPSEQQEAVEPPLKRQKVLNPEDEEDEPIQVKDIGKVFKLFSGLHEQIHSCKQKFSEGKIESYQQLDLALRGILKKRLADRNDLAKLVRKHQRKVVEQANEELVRVSGQVDESIEKARTDAEESWMDKEGTNLQVS